MKTSGVSQLSITTTAECEEPVAALLESIFAVTPTVYASAETQRSTITAYIKATPAKLRARKSEIESALAELERNGRFSGER